MRIPGSLLFLAGAATALGAGWIAFPRIIYTSRPQPVEFSHKTHADKAGAKCEDCHAFRDDGTFSGIPALAQCSGCHTAPMGTSAAEKTFIDAYVTPNREPQWAVYARQPENVYFPHIAHVKTGGLKCEECHGDHGASNDLPPYQEDRISGYSRDVLPIRAPFQRRNPKDKGVALSMTMDDCVECHEQRGMEHSCLDCHK